MNEHSKKASFFEEAFFNLTTNSETYIHPTAIIGKDVTLEPNVIIGPFCVIIGKVIIESGTRLHANVSVGFPAQVLGMKQSLGTVHIKKNCELREFVTIHASRYPEGQTVIGNNCYLMNHAHVGHDCELADNVTLINSVMLGGHTVIEKNAIIMGNSATHQFCRIGSLTALAPYSGIRQDLPPFCLFNGQPAAFSGLNSIGLKRAGLTSENIQSLKKVTNLFYKEKLPLEALLETIKNQAWGQDIYVQQFVTFIQNSKRGVSRKSILDADKNTESNS
ncbi:MAG: acyl-ACP--UDP-N-acetylglucosamine O-acyltransferase [bacterium]